MTVAIHFPQSTEGKRFCLFFPHRFNFIKSPNNGSESPDWKTISDYPIEHRNLWNTFCNKDTFVGLSFAPTTHYALFDIDTRSAYHPSNNEKLFRELLGAFEDVGFNEFIIIQSSWSEGIHVYLVLPKEVPTYKLAVMLKLTAIRSGFTVKDGTLEIFPNAKSYNKNHPTPYKAHRLPLQEGSFLLDNDFTPFSNKIKTFLDLAQSAAKGQDIELIEAAIEAADKAKAFRHIKGDGEKASLFAKDLSEQIQEGWTDFGQTNDLLRVIGTYGRVFQALDGKRLADYIATTAQSLPGYRQFCRHQHHIHQRARDWARCVEKFYYPYGSDPVRVGTFEDLVKNGAKENKVNKNRQQGAVERIKEGVKYLRETLKELPKKVGEMKEALIGAISSLFDVRPSDKTLYKHSELWHPQFLKEEEIVIEPQDVKDQVTTHDNQQPSPPSPEAPKQALEETYSPCPTPSVKEEKNGHSSNRLEPIQGEQLEEYATPPLYMKVRTWANAQMRLVFTGDVAYGLVLLEGEKKEKMQSILKNQQVVISSYEHSSYLFHSEDSNNLQVYIKPYQQQQQWQNGILVAAKYLFSSS